eukprot:c20901_g2_i1 orf=338-556(-)
MFSESRIAALYLLALHTKMGCLHLLLPQHVNTVVSQDMSLHCELLLGLAFIFQKQKLWLFVLTKMFSLLLYK